MNEICIRFRLAARCALCTVRVGVRSFSAGAAVNQRAA